MDIDKKTLDLTKKKDEMVWQLSKLNQIELAKWSKI